MGRFNEIVREEVAAGLRGLHLPVQGVCTFISPKGDWCNVRIPLPKGGVQHGAFSTEGSFLELENVPLPRTPEGLITAHVAQLYLGTGENQAPSVLVGFKGGNIHFPFIVCFLDLLPERDGQPKRAVPDRQGAMANTVNTAKPATGGPSFVAALPFSTGLPVAPPAPVTPTPAEPARRAEQARESQKDGIRGVVERATRRLGRNFRFPWDR